MATPRVCWLSGNTTERRNFLDQIRTQFAADEELHLNDEMSFAYFEQQILINSVFSETKLVIISGMPSFASTKQTMLSNFKKLLDATPATAMIVFNGIDPDSEKALSSHVRGMQLGKVVTFDSTLDKGKAAAWVVKEADRQGKTITSDDAEVLVASCGYDAKLGGIGIDRIRLEILKLVSYVGRRKNITTEDISVCAYPTEEFVIWSIFNAMDSKDFQKCNDVMFKMCQNMDSIVDAVNALFNISIGRYRLLFFLKEGIAKGWSKSEATAQAEWFLKLKQKGSGFHMKLSSKDDDGKEQRAFSDYAIKECIYGLGKRATLELYSRRDLARIISCMQDCMCEIRNRTSEYALLLLADTLFLTICTQTEEQLLKAVRTPHEFEQI